MVKKSAYKYTILYKTKGTTRWKRAGTLYKTKEAAKRSADKIKSGRLSAGMKSVNTKVVRY